MWCFKWLLALRVLESSSSNANNDVLYHYKVSLYSLSVSQRLVALRARRYGRSKNCFVPDLSVKEGEIQYVQRFRHRLRQGCVYVEQSVDESEPCDAGGS